MYQQNAASSVMTIDHLAFIELFQTAGPWLLYILFRHSKLKGQTNQIEWNKGITVTLAGITRSAVLESLHWTEAVF